MDCMDEVDFVDEMVGQRGGDAASTKIPERMRGDFGFLQEGMR